MVVTNATPTAGTLPDSATYVIDAGQTLEPVVKVPVIVGVGKSELEPRLDVVQVPVFLAESPAPALGVEVSLSPKCFEVLEPKESPDADGVWMGDEILRSETFRMAVEAVEWLDVDTVLSADVPFRPDELDPPFPLLILLGRLVGFGTSVKSM